MEDLETRATKDWFGWGSDGGLVGRVWRGISLGLIRNLNLGRGGGGGCRSAWWVGCWCVDSVEYDF